MLAYIKTVILPRANSNEASVISELNIIPISDLEELIQYLNNEKEN